MCRPNDTGSIAPVLILFVLQSLLLRRRAQTPVQRVDASCETDPLAPRSGRSARPEARCISSCRPSSKVGRCLPLYASRSYSKAMTFLNPGPVKHREPSQEHRRERQRRLDLGPGFLDRSNRSIADSVQPNGI